MRAAFPSLTISCRAGRGYGFDRVSPEIDDKLQQAVRKHWPPPGQRWTPLIGARFVRTIRLPGNQFGWIVGRVTPDHDEFGRTGLLRAKVTIVPGAALARVVSDYVNALPRSAAQRKSALPDAVAVALRVVGHRPMVFSAPSGPVNKWAAVEYLVLKSYLSLPAVLRDGVTIDTLALSTRGAGTLVGIPAEYLRGKAQVRLGGATTR
jgi:hypothetical protein